MKKVLSCLFILLISLSLFACSDTKEASDKQADSDLEKLGSSVTYEQSEKIKNKLNELEQFYDNAVEEVYTSGEDNGYDEIEIIINSEFEAIDDKPQKKGLASGMGGQIIESFHHYTNGSVIPSVTFKYQDGSVMTEYVEGDDNEGFEIIK